MLDQPDGTAARVVLGPPLGGRLVDAWAGASLVRVGPRGYRDLIMLRGLTEIACCHRIRGSTTDVGVILDDHDPARLRCGRREMSPAAVPSGENLRAQQPPAGILCGH